MKAIIIEGVLKFKDNFKEFNGTVGLQYATDQQWYDWGFREYVVPIYTNLQKLGEVFYDSISDTITYPIIDKTQLELDSEFAERKIFLIRKFENDTDNLIREIVGERANEYEIAEQEAIIFKAAGYPENDVPDSVSSDAIASGRTNIEACDLILTIATNWRAIQTALRTNRLLSKANTKNALTVGELNTIEISWETFLIYIKQQIIQ
jgi:hypothetical protein